MNFQIAMPPCYLGFSLSSGGSEGVASNLERLPRFRASHEGGLGPRKNGGRGGMWEVASNSEHLPVFRAPRKGGLGPRSMRPLSTQKKLHGKGTDRKTDIATL